MLPILLFLSIAAREGAARPNYFGGHEVISNNVDTSKPEIIEILGSAEEMPRFPGCEDKGLAPNELKQCSMEKLLQFIGNEIKYPEKARKKEIEGMAVVSFIVEKDGSVSQVKIVRDLEEGCGAEATRVVELMNERGIRWIPGKNRDRKVRVQLNLPVHFKLNEAKKEE